MNSISLLNLDLGAVLLNVLAIIGIIIAGGFLIFFLGDLLLSILDPKNNSIKKPDNQQNSQNQERLQEPAKPRELTYDVNSQINYEAQNQQQVYQPYSQEQKQSFYQAPTNQYEEVDFEKALAEEKMLFGDERQEFEPLKQQSEKFEEKNIDKDENVEDIFEALKLEEKAYLEGKLNNETVVPAFPVNSKDEDDFDDEEFNFDEIFFTNDEDNEIEENNQDDFDLNLDLGEDFGIDNHEEDNELNDIFEEENQSEEVEEFEEIQPNDEEVENLKNENDNLRKEIELLLKEQEQRKQELEDEMKKLRIAQETTKSKSSQMLTLEEYEARLAELKERLKDNQKELRAINREYLPLKKVRTTLERDKKKLRRREALVAKQKILLYGVNNMADIDTEKAKKLEEDLDLLDGLRLSVQHCEEVIKNSQERYPILETSNNILTKTISQIKSDIEVVEASIEKLSNKDSK